MNAPRCPAAVVALLLALLPTASAGDVPFGPPILIASPAGARSIAVADMDGDGDGDAVGAAFSAGTIAWYENTDGAGTAWSEHLIDGAAPNANAVHVIDLDADGDLDVLSAVNFGDEIAWHENLDGVGGTWVKRVISTDAAGALDVAAGDLDGDGTLDVLSASPFDDKIAWYRNDGGTWIENILTTSAEGATSVSVADMDGDGDLDAISSATFFGEVMWFENVFGDATAWGTRSIASGVGSAIQSHAADLDGDGDMDVASASQGPGLILWYENLTGDGLSWTSRPVSNNADFAQGVTSADFDGDGDMDILGAATADERVAWYENTEADGSVWLARPIQSGGSATTVSMGDVDGDGDLDALSASFVSASFSWHENRTIHRRALPVDRLGGPGTATDLRDTAGADIDGDGDLDVLSASLTGDHLIWWRNAGGATGWSTRVISDSAPGALLVAPADIDGDGDLDAISAYGGSTIAWHENLGGSGINWADVIIDGNVGSPRAVAGVDLDADGDVDVISCSFSGGSVLWHENTTGDGSSWSTHTVTALLSEARAVDSADIDGDGDVDLLSASSGDDRIAWYENGGGALSWTPRTISLLADDARDVIGADIDADGDIDAVASVAGVGDIIWYENAAGDGLTWTAHTLGSTSGPGPLRAIDLDGDGDVDLVSSSTGDEALRWHENLDGVGGTWAVHLLDDADTALGLDVGDLDGDGRPDLLTAESSGALGWFPDRGGQFGLPTEDMAPASLRDGRNTAMLAITLVHRGRLSDDPLELTQVVLRLEDRSGTALTSGEADALLASLVIYRDDGSGAFEAGLDELLTAIDTFDGLDPAELVVTFVDGDPRVRVGAEGSVTFFVVVTLSNDASQQTPNALRVVHVTEPSGALPDGATLSAGENAVHDIPLLLELTDTTTSSALTATDGWVNLGFGLAGTLGVAQLDGQGTLVADEPIEMSLANAPADSPVFLAVGFTQVNSPFKGGIFVPGIAPTGFLLLLTTDGNGEILVATPWPSSAPAGFSIFFQSWFADAGGPLGFASSNALSATTP